MNTIEKGKSLQRNSKMDAVFVRGLRSGELRTADFTHAVQFRMCARFQNYADRHGGKRAIPHA
ncbi:hypothetical protein [Slackia piriformis]|uniref:hypothetical protein n=1 Tax=Slackia piriformis TaxID=626934 RepID=UPI0032C0F57E